MTQRRSSPTVYSIFATRQAIRRSSWRTYWGFPVKPFRSGGGAQGRPEVDNVVKLAQIYRVSTDFILTGSASAGV